jgi:Protein of unknown function (DUF1116)
MLRIDRNHANAEVVERLVSADPVLVDVKPAIEVVPDMAGNLVLTSGPPHAFEEYDDGQRDAIVHGALFEGLANTYDDAVEGFRAGDIVVDACQEHGCIGSLAGIYTARMPVFVVENRTSGNRGFCNFYEGESHRRLNYGSWGEDVRANLVFIEEVLAPVIGEAVRRVGGIPLKPIMKRAVHLGDELHSRNTAATLLFTRELFAPFRDMEREWGGGIRKTLDFLRQSDYSFLRLSMASGKVTADSAHGVEGSSVVTSMSMSCRGVAIRVSGLGDQWFEGPHASMEGKFFEGYSMKDARWMGGESFINETVGLGGMAQAAAFPLQAYQGGSPEVMIRNNLEMYEITAGEHLDFRIPYFAYRGTPVGIDVFKVLATGITPCVDAGLAGKDGGQIGAGILRLPIECFHQAAEAYQERYGRVETAVASESSTPSGAAPGPAVDASAGSDAGQP